LAWISFIPLFRALDLSSPVKCAGLTFLTGFTSNLIALYWIAFNSGAPFPIVFASMVSAILYIALFWAILGYVFSQIHTRTGKGFFLLPFLWVFMEYVMSFGPLGFPWISVATTQVDYLPIIQLAEYTGIYGITFWVIILNIIFYFYFRDLSSFKKRFLLVGILVMVIPWLSGYLRIAQINNRLLENSFFITLVQPNIGPNEKWDPNKRDWVFDYMDSMYVEASKKNPQMIIWPESATPFYLRRNFRKLNLVKQRIESTQIPLLTGAVDWEFEDGDRKIYNSAILIHPTKPIQSYRKIQLVPLGEYNPFIDQVPISEALSLGNFTPGNSFTLFELNDVKFSTVICFESAFPQLVRKFVERGAKVLIILVNDGWFGHTSEPYQHAALSRYRAVEHRIPVVRCANTGISAIYESTGQRSVWLPVNSQGILSVGISPGQKSTFYTRFGDIFAKTSIFSFFVLGVWFWIRKK